MKNDNVVRVTLRTDSNSYGKVKHYNVMMDGLVIRSQSATNKKMAAALIKNEKELDKYLSWKAAGRKVVKMF